MKDYDSIWENMENKYLCYIWYEVYTETWSKNSISIQWSCPHSKHHLMRLEWHFHFCRHHYDLNSHSNLLALSGAVNMKTLDLGLIRTIIGDIEVVFKQLQEQFDLSMPLKMHIILHHYLDHFELTGETLLRYTDEFTESMHSQIRQFEESHHYKNLKFATSKKSTQKYCAYQQQ